MNADTPPPPLPDKRFTLPKSLLVIWFIVFGLAIYLGVSMNLDANALGQLSGRFVGVTLFSLLLSWVAWRLSRRSDWVKTTIFAIVFLLFSLDFLAGLSNQRRVAQSAQLTQLRDQARRIQDAQIEEFEKTGSISPTAQATAPLIAAMKEAGAAGNNVERTIMNTFAEFLETSADHESKFTQASDQVDFAWILRPETPKSNEEIAAVAGTVTNFMQVNQRFLAHFTNCVANLTESLKSKGVPSSQIQFAVRSFQKGIDSQIPLIQKLREQDHSFGQATLEILDLYRTQNGKWKWNPDDEVAAFTHEPSAERWLELVGQVNDIAQEQQETQGELIEMRKKISRAQR